MESAHNYENSMHFTQVNIKNIGVNSRDNEF